jgi:hypothetical protein
LNGFLRCQCVVTEKKRTEQRQTNYFKPEEKHKWSEIDRYLSAIYVSKEKKSSWQNEMRCQGQSRKISSYYGQ